MSSNPEPTAEARRVAREFNGRNAEHALAQAIDGAIATALATKDQLRFEADTERRVWRHRAETAESALAAKDAEIERLRSKFIAISAEVPHQDKPLINAVIELRAERDQLKVEIGDFQQQAYTLICSLSGKEVDGAGSDAGWQEFTLAEIAEGLNHVVDQRDQLKAEVERLRKVTTVAGHYVKEERDRAKAELKDAYQKSFDLEVQIETLKAMLVWHDEIAEEVCHKYVPLDQMLATALRTQQNRIEELEEGLRPFAAEAHYLSNRADNESLCFALTLDLEVHHIRQAAALLAEKEAKA